MVDRLIDQHRRLGPGAIDAEQRDEGRLARRGVFVHRLAGLVRRPLDVEQVVGDLEGEAEVVRITAERRPPVVGDPPHDRTRFEAEADQRAGL